jgi:hypothetical protein
MDRNGKKAKARRSGADTNSQRSDLKSQGRDVLGRVAADATGQRERGRGGNSGESPKGGRIRPG